ncbi:MAG: hypothetical protein J7501_03250 [Bdellovibrio sp.]|nr:hypothetical protein [Bdellovibrio sp.]
MRIKLIGVFASLFLSTLSAHAIQIEILKPNFRCQSRELVMDDSVYLTVLEDKVSGISHIEVVRSWFGGLRKATYQTIEKIDASTPGLPILFEGNGVQLAINMIPETKGASLDALLVTHNEEGQAHSDQLLCEELR